MSREKLINAYWNARTSVSNDDLEGSIHWLNKYIQFLPDEICHEPQYWLAFQYLKIGDNDSAFESVKEYLKGCKYPHAASLAKFFSDEFKQRGFNMNSISLLKLSKHYLQLQKDLKNKSNEKL